MIHGMMQEEELVAAPGLFPRLVREISGLGEAELHLKPAASDNELTAFRYDVILRQRMTHLETGSYIHLHPPRSAGGDTLVLVDSLWRYARHPSGRVHAEATTAPALQVRSIPNAARAAPTGGANPHRALPPIRHQGATAASIRESVPTRWHRGGRRSGRGNCTILDDRLDTT